MVDRQGSFSFRNICFVYSINVKYSNLAWLIGEDVISAYYVLYVYGAI